jgi:hypothetical protein
MNLTLTRGTQRELIAPEDVARLRAAGALIEDGRRHRPRWFDGRFLAARDLIREQQYFLTREADLGQAAGSGVAAGLSVAEGPGVQTLAIGAGHGVTPSGELVVLANDLLIRLADIPRAEQFTARFGLGRLPQPPLRTRSGLFVLALRPVEFTANPIGAYPTAITGQRTVEDGDVIEATAVVLVAWPDDGAADSLAARRGRAARAIFVEGDDRGVSASVLPLAMIALSNNSLEWIDAPMVRRELGADRNDLPGLGLAPQALRQAHLLQHQGHVADLAAIVRGRAFPAATHFPALPPAGPLPPGVINPVDFTQSYFPAEITVDFAIVPEDELPALVEESLALPGIDLTAPAETLESTAVLVLAPVPRNEWRAVIGRLTSLARALPTAAPNLVAARKPLEILQRLRLPRPVIPPLDPASPSDREWQRLAQLPTLWFVRRRNIAYREDLTGVAVRFAGVQADRTNAGLLTRLDTLGLRTNFDRVVERATPAARLEVVNLLESPRFADSPTLTAAALNELGRRETLTQADALTAGATLTGAQVGTGLTRLDATTDIGATREALQAIAKTDTDWRTLDREVAVAPIREVSTLASTGTGTTVRPVTGRLGGAVLRPTAAGPALRPAAATVATPRARGAKKAAAKRRAPR